MRALPPPFLPKESAMAPLVSTNRCLRKTEFHESCSAMGTENVTDFARNPHHMLYVIKSRVHRKAIDLRAFVYNGSETRPKKTTL